MIQDYIKAKKLGEKAYRHAVVHGQYPYLPSLEEMVRDVDKFPEIPLGTVEIPLDMIAGTRTNGRRTRSPPISCLWWRRIRNSPSSGASCTTRR